MASQRGIADIVEPAVLPGNHVFNVNKTVRCFPREPGKG
jgi:hypothetical protein